jgi:hypothetical protein
MNDRIVYQNADGGVSVVIPAPECGLSIQEIAAKDVPKGTAWRIIDANDIPPDEQFWGSWTYSETGLAIQIDIAKFKAIAHDFRRAARAEEFKPHDEIIMKQIPGADAVAAEAARAAIRAKYADMQNQIDAATTPDEIKAALGIG